MKYESFKTTVLKHRKDLMRFFMSFGVLNEENSSAIGVRIENYIAHYACERKNGPLV